MCRWFISIFCCFFWSGLIVWIFIVVRQNSRVALGPVYYCRIGNKSRKLGGERITSERNALAEHWLGWLPIHQLPPSLLPSQPPSLPPSLCLSGSRLLLPLIPKKFVSLSFSHPISNVVHFILKSLCHFFHPGTLSTLGRDVLSAGGGGLPWPGHGDEEPVHWQRHANLATRGRPRQQVRI